MRLNKDSASSSIRRLSSWRRGCCVRTTKSSHSRKSPDALVAVDASVEVLSAIFRQNTDRSVKAILSDFIECLLKQEMVRGVRFDACARTNHMAGLSSSVCVSFASSSTIYSLLPPRAMLHSSPRSGLKIDRDRLLANAATAIGARKAPDLKRGSALGAHLGWLLAVSYREAVVRVKEGRPS